MELRSTIVECLKMGQPGGRRRGEKTARGAGHGRQQEPPDSEGHVSTHAEPRSGHSSSRVLRWIVVDGKPTRVSNRNTATATSSAAAWFARLGPFQRTNCLFVLSPQFGRVTPLCDGAWT